MLLFFSYLRHFLEDDDTKVGIYFRNNKQKNEKKLFLKFGLLRPTPYPKTFVSLHPASDYPQQTATQPE